MQVDRAGRKRRFVLRLRSAGLKSVHDDGADPACGQQTGDDPCIRSWKQDRESGALDREYFSELEKLSGDVGGRAVIEKHWEKCLCVETREEELRDIDRRSDLF